MVKVTTFFAYFTFFILALMYFSPKISIYNFVENKLKNHEIIISNEAVMDNGFNLDLTDASVSVKGVESAIIDETDVKIYGVYNSVTLKGIALSRSANLFIPINIEKVTVSYTILNPINIEFKAFGEFGEAYAEFNLFDRNLHLKLNPSNKMLKDYKTTLENLKKSESGEYIYDKNI